MTAQTWPHQLRLFDETAAAHSLREVVERHYTPQRLIGKSLRTIDEYRSLLNNVDAYVVAAGAEGRGESSAIDSIDEDWLARFVAWRFASRRVAAATCNKDLRMMRAVLKFARRKKFLRGDVEISFLPEVQTQPACWSLEELGRLLAACDSAPSDALIPGPAPERWRLLILLFYDTGARLNALLQTTWLDVIWDTHDTVIKLSARHQKHAADEFFTVSDQTAEKLRLLRRFAAGPEAPVWYWPYDRGDERSWPTLRRRYRKIVQAAGLPDGHEHLFHCLRRTNATYTANESYKQGLDGLEAARRALGHSSVSVTRRYIDPNKCEPLRVSAKKLPRPKQS